MKHLFLLIVFFGIFTIATAQEMMNNDTSDFYYEIPAYPPNYTAGNVAARVVDGLGFRYYWATHGLRGQDLTFKPTEESRTTNQTLDHLYSLVTITYNAVAGKSNADLADASRWSFEEKRAYTLNAIQQTSELLKASTEEDLASFNAQLGATEYPFWNMLNGPIADALWHVGQVVTFRRSCGNPLNSNASMLRGRLRN